MVRDGTNRNVESETQARMVSRAGGEGVSYPLFIDFL